MQSLTLKPHIAGSPQNIEYGKTIQNLFSSYGIPQTWVEEHPVLLSYPSNVSRSLSITGPASTYYASMYEPVVNDSSLDPELVVPTFHGYSPSGSVTGKLVYVNYGTAADYAYLDFIGISVKDRIVIARYGHGFRGDKCLLGAARGAVGCIIYSDPIDSGYLKGDTYPNGPWLPEEGVQRGSVWPGAGDPVTPGWPSSPTSPRLTLDQARDASNPDVSYPLPTIPMQPISAKDAKPFLEALLINQAPQNMSGSNLYLPNGYFFGPSTSIVNLTISNSFETRNIQNIFGKIPGSVEPDRVVLVGVHHDAWTYGGADPISGTVSMLEVVRAFGQMYKAGWRPRRSIVFASWDSEEYGLTGSTEFCELHFKEITNRVVAYLNLDISVAGTDRFLVMGTPNFNALMQKVTKLVSAPSGKTGTVYDLWAPQGTSPTVWPIGAGSDHAPFISHVGVSSMMMEFDAANVDNYATYHSRYDSYMYSKNFLDPTWEYHTAVSKVLGLVTKAFADSFVLPYDFVTYASTLSAAIQSLETNVNAIKPANVNLTLAWHVLEQSNIAFANTADSVSAQRELLLRAQNPDPFQLRDINDRLFLTERAFLDYKGFPGQPWLRHMIYAPSNTDSYSADLFPTVVNAAFAKTPNWTAVYNQIMFVADAINSATDVLGGGNGHI